MPILIQLVRHFNTLSGGGNLFAATFEDTF